MKDDSWLCMHCDRRGDLLDYVLCEHPRMTPVEAVRHIQRTLGERITELVSALSPILPTDTKPHSLTRRLNASSQALAQQYGVQYESHRTKDSREITLSPLAS